MATHNHCTTHRDTKNNHKFELLSTPGSPILKQKAEVVGRHKNSYVMQMELASLSREHHELLLEDSNLLDGPA